MNTLSRKQLLYAFEQAESLRDDCFLCRPAVELIAHNGTEHYTMAGLGPLTDGYAIIATKIHNIDKVQDKSTVAKNLSKYTEKIQATLVNKFGSCILTEHGKMPLCIPNAPSGSHCFHQHFLLYPGAPDPLPEFIDYFESEGIRFESLFEALNYAVRFSNYILTSSKVNEYYVFDAPNGLPRQFARAIVAEIIGTPDLASWRDYPNGEWSLKNATLLRRVLADNL